LTTGQITLCSLKKGKEDQMNLFVLNQAAKTLIDSAKNQTQADVEALQAIVDEISKIPDSNNKGLYLRQSCLSMKSGEKVQGYTNEAGTVSMDTGENTEYAENVQGFTEARAGHYKFYRLKTTIYFRHFWKSDITTSADLSDIREYYITYSQETNKPIEFGYLGEREIFMSLVFVLSLFCTLIYKIKSFFSFIFLGIKTKDEVSIRFLDFAEIALWKNDNNKNA
jgi:hypothetical protein